MPVKPYEIVSIGYAKTMDVLFFVTKIIGVITIFTMILYVFSGIRMIILQPSREGILRKYHNDEHLSPNTLKPGITKQ